MQTAFLSLEMLKFDNIYILEQIPEDRHILIGQLIMATDHGMNKLKTFKTRSSG